MHKYTSPEKTKSALITIDIQNDFTLEDAPAKIPGTIEVLPNIRRLLDVFREKRLPIIHVIRLYLTDASNVDLCRKEIIESGKQIAVPHSNGAELVDEIKPSIDSELNADLLFKGKLQQLREYEWVMYKPRWGAFYNTPLEEHLKNIYVNTLVFCGCNFPNCPRTSIYEASERDLKIILAKDAISQVYDQGLSELENIGVFTMSTRECVDWLA